MKKLFGLMVGFLVLGGVFTSCLKDEDTGLSVEEQRSAYLQVKGDYNGKLVYSKQLEDKSAYVNDTVDVSWSIATDSTLLIKQFPSAALAEGISNNDIKAAMASANPVDIKCYTGFNSLSPVIFLINPSVVTYRLTYGDTTHKVQVVFYVNNGYSYGVYRSSTNLLEMQIIEAGIYVDDSYNASLLTKAVPFKLYCKKG